MDELSLSFSQTNAFSSEGECGSKTAWGQDAECDTPGFFADKFLFQQTGVSRKTTWSK